MASSLLSFLPWNLFYKSFFTSEHFPKVYFLIWISLVGIGALGYTVWQVSFHLAERDFDVEIGYDDEKRVTWEDITANVKGNFGDDAISFNGGLSSKVANLYGYKSAIFGYKKIHFAPKELDVTFFKNEMIAITVPQNTKKMILYLNKNGELYVYADKILIETHRLKE